MNIKKLPTIVCNQKLIRSLVVLTIFLLSFKLPTDTDLGWHLRYGKRIFETGEVFRKNEIGFFLPDYQWAHSYSLHQIISFVLSKYFGFGSLAFLGAGIIASIAIFIFLSFPKKTFWAIFGIALTFFLSLPATGMGYRSQMLSILGFTTLLYILSKPLTWKNLAIIPFIFLVWINVHGGFMLGFALLTFCFLEKVIQKNNSCAIRLAIISCFSFLISLINPFGFKLYLESYRHIWYPLNKLIAEWTPPNRIFILVILSIGSYVLVKLLTTKNLASLFRKNKMISLSLGWIFFGYLSLKARRHLPFFALSSAYLLPLLSQKKRVKNKLINLIGNSLIVFTCLMVIFWQSTHLPNLSNYWQQMAQKNSWPIPQKAIDHLKGKEGLCPNMFNTYEWGGYLAWHLPKTKTFVDGRMPAWPTPERKSPYTIYLEIIQARKGFDQRLFDYGANCLFISKGTFLDLELKKNPDHPWEIIYQDDRASIYKKEG